MMTTLTWSTGVLFIALQRQNTPLYTCQVFSNIHSENRKTHRQRMMHSYSLQGFWQFGGDQPEDQMLWWVYSLLFPFCAEELRQLSHVGLAELSAQCGTPAVIHEQVLQLGRRILRSCLLYSHFSNLYCPA